MRIAFAWWGTWWHVVPIQSLIKYINKNHNAEHDFLWFGEKPSLEYDTFTQLQASIPKITFITITSGKRRREKWWLPFLKNIWWLFSLTVGIWQSLYWLKKEKIDIVFCKWWYVSLPVVFAAYLLRKPIFLHESDTKPGLANRICSMFASTIFTWFSEVFPGKEIVVGQILDDDIVPSKSVIKDVQGEKNKITHVLVTWGSQGAQSLYAPLIELLSTHKLDAVCFYVILGTKNKDMAPAFSAFPNVVCYDFVSQIEMGKLLLLCDVAITRGWTTSLAEQHLFRMKKIIVPIPWTHDQLKNAKYYEKHDNDVLVMQDTDSYKDCLFEAVLSLAQYKKTIALNHIVQNVSEPKRKIVAMMIKK